MSEEKKDVPSGKEGETSKETKPSDSVGSDSGQTKADEALSKVPDNLKGKSVEELAQMYQNLEKKLGEQSSEVKEAREAKKDIEVLLGSIYADPERYKTASSWIKEYLGQETQGKTKPVESGEGAETGAKPEGKPKGDDTRRALQNQALADFYKKYGLEKLPEDERKTEQKKIANAFAELIDPGGTKTVQQLLDEVPVDRLPKFLDSAYVLANKDKVLQEGMQRGLLAAEEKRQASIGSLSSSSGGEKGITLTPEERAAAEKMKISPEDYAKAKEKRGTELQL